MRKMLPHQKRSGMTTRYINSRLQYMHACEMRHREGWGSRNGRDMRMYDWAMRFKPFLTWGKP